MSESDHFTHGGRSLFARLKPPIVQETHFGAAYYRVIERGSTMLSTTPGTGCFVQVPDESSQRILHSAVVQGFATSAYSAELQEDAAPLESGQDIFVYYESSGKFARQPARIVVIVDTPSGCTFTFQFTGDAESGETRQCYRVSTIMAAVTATLGDEENCPVVDVSATGFAVIAAEQYMATDIVEATIRFEGETFSGQGRIESVQELSAGRIRYGLHCVDGKATSETLGKGLQQISATVQRQHLRRLSRTG
ncbi:MAG: PilZ domain-containing protein [Phycisphaerales bacterium]